MPVFPQLWEKQEVLYRDASVKKLLEFLNLDPWRVGDKVSGPQAACSCFSLVEMLLEGDLPCLVPHRRRRILSWGWSDSDHTALLCSDEWVSD